MYKTSGKIVFDSLMLKSPCFMSLTSTAKTVLLLFYCRRKLSKVGRHGKGKWLVINNGEILFPYSEAEKKFGIKKSTFARAITQLIEHGFIDINHHGGGMLGDATTYFISERWYNYGTDKFIAKTRMKDTRKLGFASDKMKKRLQEIRRSP
jgi:N-acetylglucosamine-6-phosphate deacetylase